MPGGIFFVSEGVTHRFKTKSGIPLFLTQIDNQYLLGLLLAPDLSLYVNS